MTPLRQIRARNRLRRKRSGTADQRHLPLSAHVLVMVAGALAVLATLLWLLLSDTTTPLSPSPDDQTILEVVRLAFYAVAGIGGVIALTVAYRRQRITEAEIEREDAKLFSERFAAAAEQLASERAANRLAGVYAMAALADDWDAGRQTCVNVLCAYMRMPYEPPPPRGERESLGIEPFKNVLEERLVRKTVMTVIGDRLRTEPIDGKTWHECDFDFTGATLDEADFHDAVFKGRVSFARARFPIGNLSFIHAEFHGPVDFGKALFIGSRVYFLMAQFKDRAIFSGVTLSDGLISFQGTTFNTTERHFIADGPFFDRSIFSGGALTFELCNFESHRTASFTDAAFSGSSVSFRHARFTDAELIFTQPADWTHPPEFDDFPDGPPPGLRLPETES